MKVLIKKAGQQELIEKEIADNNKLKEMQDIVGGWIERVPIKIFSKNKIDIWADEEGLLKEKPANMALICTDGMSGIIGWVVGDILFCSYNEDGDSISLDKNQEQFIKDYVLNNSVSYTDVEGNNNSITKILI